MDFNETIGLNAPNLKFLNFNFCERLWLWLSRAWSDGLPHNLLRIEKSKKYLLAPDVFTIKGRLQARLHMRFLMRFIAAISRRFIARFQIARVNQLRFHGDLTAICRRCFELARILMRFIGDLIHLLQLAIQIAIKIAVKSQVVSSS